MLIEYNLKKLKSLLLIREKNYSTIEYLRLLDDMHYTTSTVQSQTCYTIKHLNDDAIALLSPFLNIILMYNKSIITLRDEDNTPRLLFLLKRLIIDHVKKHTNI